MSEKFSPTCRYGHGPLSQIEQIPSDHRWGLAGVTIAPLTAGSPVNRALSASFASGRIYTVSVHRCQICGYLELFDDEVLNG
ncbi:hypothetical protein [Cupriavidus basilensis]|uniref:hypothetical protein n=1 Tax=Cupriavidus basilensis TaxID=68895 RepID=UPI0011856633|nr:hypothetical protein [Cupriavidus basilensis]